MHNYLEPNEKHLQFILTVLKGLFFNPFEFILPRRRFAIWTAVCFVFGRHLRVCAGVHVGLTASVVYIQRHNDKAMFSTSDFLWTNKACEIHKDQLKLGNPIWGKLNESLCKLHEVVSITHS